MPRPPFDPSKGVKRCPSCKRTKPLDEFNRSSHTIHGYSVYCKICTTARHDEWRRDNLEHCRKASKKWRNENPRAARDHILRAKYGLPLGGYEKLLAAQDGKCAICDLKKSSRGDLHVDHCHATKQIRGLLCHRCNIGIGNFQHDIRLLNTAIRYLTRTSS